MRYSIFCLILSGFLKSYAQTVFVDANAFRFVLEVKQIDEFIERFNFEDETLLRTYFTEKFPEEEVTHEDLLRTLFDHEKPNWDIEIIQRFTRQVVENATSDRLAFLSENWYAEARCEILYNGKSESVVLLLQIEQAGLGASKWVIRQIDADFLQIPKEVNSQKSLNPISHGTDFMGLDKAFSDHNNLRNYLNNGFAIDEMSVFTHEVQKGKITFQQVNAITYHFLQVDNWIFTVDQYLRTGSNSGWLISDLIPATLEDKELYKVKILHLDM